MELTSSLLLFWGELSGVTPSTPEKSRGQTFGWIGLGSEFCEA